MLINIPLDRIDPNPWQTRLGDPDPQHVKSLAMDIAQNGLLQNPLGRLMMGKHPFKAEVIEARDGFQAVANYHDTRVQLAFGHNRLAAFRWLNDLRDNSNISEDYTTIPIDLRPLTDEQMADYAWSENERRRDVTPIERAQAIQRRMNDFQWTQQQIADHLGISRPVISNSLRLLKLPDQVQVALASGDISERVAIALMGLYDLPESLYTAVEKGYSDYKPSKIIANALAGKLTSDQIRSQIQYICENSGMKLQSAEWGLDDLAPADVSSEVLQSPICRTCDHRIKERNICLDRACYIARQSVVRRTYLEQASQASGILAVYTGLDNETSFQGWQINQSGHTAKIKSSGCENLRLTYRTQQIQPDSYLQDYPPGYPQAQIVCQKRSGQCTCLKALEATKIVRQEYNPANGLYEKVEIPTDLPSPGEQPTAAQLANLAAMAKDGKREANRYAKEMVGYVGEQIANALRSNSVKAWKKLAAEVHYQCGQAERNAADIMDAIGRQFAEKNLPYQFQTVLEVERAMAKLLEDFGAGITPALDEHFPNLSEQYQKRMARLKSESDLVAARCQAEGKTLVDLLLEEEIENTIVEEIKTL
jgi:ParB/RepB/Spo0J family partition protein